MGCHGAKYGETTMSMKIFRPTDEYLEGVFSSDGMRFYAVRLDVPQIDQMELVETWNHHEYKSFKSMYLPEFDKITEILGISNDGTVMTLIGKSTVSNVISYEFFTPFDIYSLREI